MSKHADRIIVAGTFKFRDAPNIKNQVISFGCNWLTSDEENIVHLYVREADKKQVALGFTYRLPQGQTDHQPFFEKITDRLKRHFGNDYVGWDVSSPVAILR